MTTDPNPPLSEAEIQVLASVQEALDAGVATDRQTLEKRAERFWRYKLDWQGVFTSLREKGHLQGDGEFQLTDSGQPLARQYHAERPDMYWYYYRDFYYIADRSEAHSKFCEAVYGRDLSQEGQVDMASLDEVISQLDARADDRIIDIGCGAGGIAEYLADVTGAHVTGLDLSPSGIAVARDRTAHKRDRLDFMEGDINNLSLPPDSFDAAILIDSIYWAADTREALSSVARLVKAGGKVLVLVEQSIDSNESDRKLDANRTKIARALDELSIPFEVTDYTESFLPFWPRAREAAEALREEFIRDDARILCDNWLQEADNYIADIDADLIRRYLYTFTVE